MCCKAHFANTCSLVVPLCFRANCSCCFLQATQKKFVQIFVLLAHLQLLVQAAALLGVHVLVLQLLLDCSLGRHGLH